MMTLLSEDPHEVEIAAARRVLPLDFEEIGDPASPCASEVLTETSATFADLDRDVVRELEARLESQIEQHAREMEEVCRRTNEIREQMQKEADEAIACERQAIIQACERFARERTQYFAAVEEEVVRLSLAIAARVLHREAAMDPLLLKGAVRVALEKVQASETAILQVPEKQVENWKAILLEAHREDVRVIGDSRLQNGECVLETSIGRVELGVKAQL
jgi:flagellar assembly protein FliH